MSSASLRLPILLLVATASLCACVRPWNNPYPPQESAHSILYRAFIERPKHLDPARSYSEEEAVIISQIYQPPLQYHYLLRPYTLIPLAAQQMPRVTYLNAKGAMVAENSPAVAFSRYEIHLAPGQRYQPHPALARKDDGTPFYVPMPKDILRHTYRLSDFTHNESREVTAADYLYGLKRLAHPAVNCPIAPILSQYIVDFKELSARLAKLPEGADLTDVPFAGAELVDRYTYRITLKGKYPQFLYWLTLNFFAPVPKEADQFYNQPGMIDKNLTLDWYPVGSGPYMLTEYNPISRMVLSRNPNFAGERYPDQGEPGDPLGMAGQNMPFIDQVVFSREQESIPYWNKFLQGYYDLAGLGSDTFDQTVRMGAQGDLTLTPEMQQRGLELEATVSPAVFFLAFNWLDPVVGGEGGEQSRLLRRAISMAVDWQEFIAIFANGRGMPAQGPIPPGVDGYQDGEKGMNKFLFDWTAAGPRLKPLGEAQALMTQAGYPGGRDKTTGEALTLYLDTVSDDKSRLDWYRKQFAKLGIQLEIRATDYNRFQDKVRNAKGQIFFLGWNADYPDPENFLFLLYGPQGKAKYQGENSANYSNPEYDRLFTMMSTMKNSPQRQEIIEKMLNILREDAPWSFGFYPQIHRLSHQWVGNLKSHGIARNTLKYITLDPTLREAKRQKWNQPSWWPAVLLVLLVLAGWWLMRRRARHQHQIPTSR